MASFSAKSKSSECVPRTVVFIVYDDIVLLDLVGPLQVFSHALDQESGLHGYACKVVSFKSDLVETNTVVSIPSEPISSCDNQEVHTLIIVGGDGANIAMHDETLLETIRGLSLRAHRVCSVCSGALVLAAAGLLNGRRAVTHWDDCKKLQNEFPQVQVEIDPIYIKDGNVWTSAGITAGIDMALAIVAEDLGRKAAIKMAQSMVTHMVRSGGQSQFSPVLDRQLLDRTGQFEELHQWIGNNLQIDLRVDALAAKLNMSSRNFSRLYTSQMGLTPAKTVEAIRVEAARDLLENTDLGVKQIAIQCGFMDEERMRRAFLRLLNIPPSDYRQGFRPAVSGP
ncbi:MAG: DJ-1/PfpI family protein [Rhizobiaceae bacterium]|nr:DJ-1/PfpI family protein [Rhizobiaceae bacterium]